jgi:hypothetical protein
MPCRQASGFGKCNRQFKAARTQAKRNVANRPRGKSRVPAAPAPGIKNLRPRHSAVSPAVGICPGSCFSALQFESSVHGISALRCSPKKLCPRSASPQRRVPAVLTQFLSAFG